MEAGSQGPERSPEPQTDEPPQPRWGWGVHRVLGLMYGPLPIGWIICALGIALYLVWC
jgi:hypothetical protein